MKSDKSMWVECLNCGHPYLLENYAKRMNSSCCLCHSKEYKVIERDDYETQDDIRQLLRMDGAYNE